MNKNIIIAIFAGFLCSMPMLHSSPGAQLYLARANRGRYADWQIKDSTAILGSAGAGVLTSLVLLALKENENLGFITNRPLFQKRGRKTRIGIGLGLNLIAGFSVGWLTYWFLKRSMCWFMT